MRNTPMIFRFSLYGFLKNQQYYDGFIILAFLDKGLSFFMIGLLIGFRELAVNLMEVPTGVLADLAGRRKAMILSFASYIVSFVIFATSRVPGHLFAAMFFYAVGEAFRTGTHKAMILDWLRLVGRENEKTKTYGYTRSWSKMGSALCVVIAMGLVFHARTYSIVFWCSTIPYVLGIINFLGYPAELDGRHKTGATLGAVVRSLVQAFGKVFRESRLRRVIIEAMGFEGLCKVAKDYLQPVLQNVASGAMLLALPVLAALQGIQRTAIIVGCVLFVQHLASSVASRKAHVFADHFGGEDRASRRLLVIVLGLLIPLTACLYYGVMWPAVICFVVLELVRNFWRPMTITRVDNETEAKMGATMLSIESQAKATGAMILAPLIGYAVDRFAAAPDKPALWIVGAAGLLIALAGALTPAMTPAPDEPRKGDA